MTSAFTHFIFFFRPFLIIIGNVHVADTILMTATAGNVTAKAASGRVC